MLVSKPKLGTTYLWITSTLQLGLMTGYLVMVAHKNTETESEHYQLAGSL